MFFGENFRILIQISLNFFGRVLLSTIQRWLSWPIISAWCQWRILRYIMMTSSNGNISWWRHQMQSFDVFFDLRQNKRLSKQSWGGWFETSLRSLWRHCNDENIYLVNPSKLKIYPQQWENNETKSVQIHGITLPCFKYNKRQLSDEIGSWCTPINSILICKNHREFIPLNSVSIIISLHHNHSELIRMKSIKTYVSSPH